MVWNWELPHWPIFKYEAILLAEKEEQFLLKTGEVCAYLKTVNAFDYQQFVVEMMSTEGIESARIEGESLDRESLQSSIKQHFELKASVKKQNRKESGMATLLCHTYETFDQPLTKETLWFWHAELFKDSSTIEDQGKYRTHSEPMQIVSNRFGSSKVFFEAPPSIRISQEMKAYLDWFNQRNPVDSILGKAAIAHLYFESIHPFEDGNGRIGRLLVEKVLSQGVNKPVLIAVSRLLEKRKKDYYAALEKCNRTLDVTDWVIFFSEIILEAQLESIRFLNFIIHKSKLMTKLSSQINPRQEKVLLRMFAEGLEGFKGGLSAENYITITKTSKATATRDLVDLVQKQALIKTGALRHTRYWLNLEEFPL